MRATSFLKNKYHEFVIKGGNNLAENKNKTKNG